MDSLPNPSLSKSFAGFRDFDRHANSPVYTKKRKLSADGQESETSISMRTDSITENFSKMHIDSKPRAPHSLSSTPNLFDQETPVLRIPKPMKLGKIIEKNYSADYEPLKPSLNQPKNEDFLQNLIKFSQTDVTGISKYLDLDLENKIREFDKTIKKDEDGKKPSSSSIIASFFNTPFASPVGVYLSNLALHTPTFEKKPKLFDGLSDFKNDSFKMIGPLTREERMEKIQRFLDKKKTRKWKQVRYGVRKELADQRERVQGRFVKTKRSPFKFDDARSDGSADSLISLTKKCDRLNLMDAEFIKNNLSNSSTDLQSSLLSDS